MSPIQKQDKLYKKFKHSGLETDKDNFKVALMNLQIMILKKMKSYFEKELAKKEQIERTLKRL